MLSKSKWLLILPFLVGLIAFISAKNANAHAAHQYTHSEPSNQFSPPHCATNIRKLPIHLMRADKGKGSGRVTMSSAVLIAKNTWATSAHGVANGESHRVTIFLPGAREVEARVTWFDVGKDIAILSGDSYNIRPMDSMSFDIGEHEQVWSIGYPGIYDSQLVSFTGMFVRYNDNAQIISTTLGLKGMSGGALVRCVEGRLELFGIITNLVKTVIKETVYTNKDGILHIERVLTNSGVSLSTPITAAK